MEQLGVGRRMEWKMTRLDMLTDSLNIWYTGPSQVTAGDPSTVSSQSRQAVAQWIPSASQSSCLSCHGHCWRSFAHILRSFVHIVRSSFRSFVCIYRPSNFLSFPSFLPFQFVQFVHWGLYITNTAIVLLLVSLLNVFLLFHIGLQLKTRSGEVKWIIGRLDIHLAWGGEMRRLDNGEGRRSVKAIGTLQLFGVGRRRIKAIG